jgi:poly-gamma-glutamate capsule biosynthesis protein CapA/YwtB (metallophosphatase superfamily)
VSLKLFLCGDVMTGRGIDQILAQPSNPQLYEDYVKSAVGYLQLAESRSGPIPRPVAASYIWGDALAEFERAQPLVRIINLETAVTRSEDRYAKAIHYRMHPQNVNCLVAAGIDGCVLANNHVLDWGQAGLLETLDVLHAAGIHTAGAGRNRAEAERPAVLGTDAGGRVLVFAFACTSSGVPWAWAADSHRPGVCLLNDLSQSSVHDIGRLVSSHKAAGDIAIASLHWGGNWGYEIDAREIRFAHSLIDHAGIDLVHGHSSHHAKAMEVYRGKLIIYGCGDLINDYEGIGGHEQFRGDLGLMYFPTVAPNAGALLGLELVPMQMRRFRLQRVSLVDSHWLGTRLAHEGRQFGTTFEQDSRGCLQLRWAGHA